MPKKKKTMRAGGRWSDTMKSVRNRQATGRVEGVERDKKKKAGVSTWIGWLCMWFITRNKSIIEGW